MKIIVLMMAAHFRTNNH